MKPLRIFISSVQKEFALERAALRDYLQGDALMRRFFAPFLFEELPAADRRVDAVYLDEVARCDLYVGLFGDDYGFVGAEGIPPTEREFRHATELGKTRLIYVKGVDDKAKHPKMRALIRQAGSELIRRRFTDTSSLIAAVYASLVAYLEEHKLILNGPFDSAPCRGATPKDLDETGMKTFIRDARASRGFGQLRQSVWWGPLRRLPIRSRCETMPSRGDKHAALRILHRRLRRRGLSRG